MPSNLVVGARYEQTDVHSANSQLVPTSLLWQDDNDFQVNRPTVPTIVTGDGSYNNILPNLDFAWFPLANPGIVSIPLAFILGIVGTLTSPDRGDPGVNAEFEVRSLTGVGAEKAVAH